RSAGVNKPRRSTALRPSNTRSTVGLPAARAGRPHSVPVWSQADVPHFYRSSPEFVAAAESAVGAAAPRQPVTLLTVEVDPGPALRASPESAIAAIAEVLRHTLRADDHVGAVGAEAGELVVVLAGAAADDPWANGSARSCGITTSARASGA